MEVFIIRQPRRRLAAATRAKREKAGFFRVREGMRREERIWGCSNSRTQLLESCLQISQGPFQKSAMTWILRAFKPLYYTLPRKAKALFFSHAGCGFPRQERLFGWFSGGCLILLCFNRLAFPTPGHNKIIVPWSLQITVENGKVGSERPFPYRETARSKNRTRSRKTTISHQNVHIMPVRHDI